MAVICVRRKSTDEAGRGLWHAFEGGTLSRSATAEGSGMHPRIAAGLDPEAVAVVSVDNVWRGWRYEADMMGMSKSSNIVAI
jgi:hypothetical protein